MKYKTVIFDLDGTLLNTLDEIADCANQVLLEKGCPIHDLNAYRFFVGEGVAILFEKALPANNRNKDVIQACIKMFTKIYDDKNRKSKVTLYDGIAALLNKLEEMKIKIAILSNKPHNLTLKSVDDFLSKWRFDVVFGQRDHVPRKPDPAGAIEIAKRLGILPSECLYLGDTAIDMSTAVSAGMFPIGVLWGFRDKTELVRSGAEKTIHHPMEVINLLNENG